ncbi:MAG: hypothetical protein ACRDF7_02620 [Candidatus Limnocylindrales bacterium]
MTPDVDAFLDREGDAWLPYQALIELDDLALERPWPADGPTHGWSGRDLLGHLLFWQGHALDVARELADGDTSPTRERWSILWDERGDALNDDLVVEWRRRPLDELRRLAGAQPRDLRDALVALPASRWLERPDVLTFFLDETTDHYGAHRPELAALIGAP